MAHMAGDNLMVKGLCLVAAACVLGGCVEFGSTMRNGTGGARDFIGVPGGDGEVTQPDDGVPSGQLTAHLIASNVSPQLNEEVFLSCEVVDGDPSGAVFTLQSSADRLIVDSVRGGARFVVDASDLNTEIAITCTAANDTGTSAQSNRITIIPTG